MCDISHQDCLDFYFYFYVVLLLAFVCVAGGCIGRGLGACCSNGTQRGQ